MGFGGEWAFTQTLNIEGKKNKIFQSLRVGDNTGMGDWMVKCGIYGEMW